MLNPKMKFRSNEEVYEIVNWLNSDEKLNTLILIV